MIAPFKQSVNELRWTRASVVVFAVIAAAMALNPPGDIVEITIFSGSLYAVCFFPAVVFGLYSQRGTAPAVIASMVVGVCVLLVWLSLGYRQSLHEVFPALACSIAAYVLMSRLYSVKKNQG